MIKLNQYFTRIAVMGASGCLLIFLAGRYTPVTPVSIPSTIESAIGQQSGRGLKKHFSELFNNGWNELFSKTKITFSGWNIEEEGYTPSVLRYNLMAIPLAPSTEEEGASLIQSLRSHLPVTGEDTDMQMEEVITVFGELVEPVYKAFQITSKIKAKATYGGQMHDRLSKKDAEWTSSIYKWLQSTPERAAKMKGISSSAIVGKYNPLDKNHIPDKPETWLIPTWKNVSVQFYDGDGRPIELYSNIQAITAMASVYTYYTNWDDTDAFWAYAESLWDASHSYSTKISDVYYCSGCVDPNNPDFDMAELVAPKSDAGEGAEKKEAVIPTEESTEVDISAPALEQRADGASESLGQAGQDLAVMQIQNGTQTVLPEGAAQPAQVAPLSPPAAPAQPGQPSQDGSQAAEQPTSQYFQTEGDDSKESQAMLSSQVSGDNISPGQPADGQNPFESTVIAENQGEGDIIGQEQGGQTEPSLPEDILEPAGNTIPELELNEEGKFCPGHVDLTVTAKIIGLTEKNSLYNIDKTAGNPKKYSEAWHGWDAYTKTYVSQLYGQDWERKYGLTLMSLAIGKPLTSLEINNYMGMLPPDTSRERRAVVAYALNSVGKIPYYYGGKSKGPGYEVNKFSTPINPDRKGRILSGLDCSGWINWVYWSVTGNAPTVYGTSGLSHAGRGISRSELKPGDIIVVLGSSPHVVMFLSWASNDMMICIQETGEPVNNVIVSTMPARWPYYRALLD